MEKALPALRSAENALKVLEKKDIDLLKSFKNPPRPVKAVLHGLCLIMNPNPTDKKKNNETLKMEIDWWAASIKVL